MSDRSSPPVAAVQTADYIDRVNACITDMENVMMHGTRFQGKQLVAPDRLIEWRDCMFEYITTYAPPGQTTSRQPDYS